MQVEMKNVLLTGTPVRLHQVQTFATGRFTDRTGGFNRRLKNVRRILSADKS